MKTVSIATKSILTITGEFIRQKRKTLGYNSNGLVVAANVSQPVISSIERGQYPGLKFQTLYSILQFLESSMAELDMYIRDTQQDHREQKMMPTNL